MSYFLLICRRTYSECSVADHRRWLRVLTRRVLMRTNTRGMFYSSTTITTSNANYTQNHFTTPLYSVTSSWSYRTLACIILIQNDRVVCYGHIAKRWRGLLPKTPTDEIVEEAQPESACSNPYWSLRVRLPLIRPSSMTLFLRTW